jgi:hypothetical protein
MGKLGLHYLFKPWDRLLATGGVIEPSFLLGFISDRVLGDHHTIFPAKASVIKLSLSCWCDSSI